MTREPAASVDVLVIGGGIIGLSTAHSLAQRGVRRVAVAERGRCGQGSTARATGGIRSQFGSEINIRLSLRSLEVFRDWRDRIGGDVGYNPIGYLFLATSRDQQDRLLAGVDLQRRLGARVEVWSVDDVARHHPALSVEGVLSATYGPDDGMAVPLAAVRSLVEACQSRGVRIWEDSTVSSIERSSGRVRGVRIGDRRVAADVVVLAAGAWSSVVGGMAGLDLPIEPRHRQAYRAGPSPQLPRRSPHTVDLGTGVYFRVDDDGLLFGGGDRTSSPPGFDYRVRPEDAPRIVELLAHRLAAVRQTPVTSMWAGLREMTPDGLGILGYVDGPSGLFVAAGFSGHGFKHAPAVGEIAAAMIDGDEPPFDVSAMSPGRFEAGVRPEPYAF